MSTHITCHSNDCLPNQYPPPRPTQPTQRDYGNLMLSDYEKRHVMYQSIPTIQTDVEGGTSFPQEDDVDLLPLYRRVAELNCQPISMDPALCVTPEKCIQNKSKNAISHDRENSFIKGVHSKNMQMSRVRFDQQVTVQHLSPEQTGGSIIVEIDRTGDNELELTFDDVQCFPNSEDGDSECSDTQPKAYIFDSIRSDTDCASKLITQTNELNLSNDIETYIETIDTQGNSDKIISPVLRKIARSKERKNKYKPDLSEEDVIEVKPKRMADYKAAFMESGGVENVLARPEFNSTLFMSKEVQALTKKEMDLPAAVSQALRTEKMRTMIQEKASLVLNDDNHQFPGLVSVEVREDDILEAAEKRICKAKPTHRPKQPRPEDMIARPPDIMDFFTPDLQREIPSLTLQNLSPPSNALKQADPLSAFDIYQHVRGWEEW